MTYTVELPTGGAIDTSRPMLPNPDGSFSTERTITIEADGKHYLIPTIVGGKQRSESDAVSLWRSGQNPDVGAFSSAQEADTAAVNRSAKIGDVRGRYTVTLPEADASSQVARGAGLGVRSLVNGAAGIPMMALNAGIGIGNLVNRGTNALGLTDAAPFPSASELTDRAMSSLGIAKPETGGERVASDVLSAATGAGGVAKFAESQAPKAASEVERMVLERLGKSQPMQVASGVTGGLASSAIREAGGGPLAQFAAGVAGSFAPSATQAGVASATRGAVRGGEAGRQQMADRLQTFEEAGVNPSAGQASGNRAIQSVESGLANVSSSAGVMDRAAEREAREMGARVESLANELVPKANATRAGVTIEKGLNKFVDRFKAEQGFLYDKVDALIPEGVRVDVRATKAALEDLNASIPGAPNTSRFFRNQRIGGIEEALKQDTETVAGPYSLAGPIQKQILDNLPPAERAATLNGLIDGKLPWEALTKLRTLVGREITDSSLASDVPRSKWKALYGALSEDMQGAAQESSPAAEKALNRATWFTRAGHDRIEGILDKVSGKDTAERIFQAATNPSEMRQGGTTVGTVMKSLEPEERKAVTAAVIRRMGIANPGQQNDLGETFSSQKFLTSWNSISPEARMSLFPESQVRTSLDQIASAANMIREGSKVFANPSGTSPAISNQVTGFSIVGSALAGRPSITAGLVALLTGANISARLLTKPEFVKWLAKSTQVSDAMLPAQMQQLTLYANKHWAEQDKADLAAYLNGVAQAGSQAGQQ